MSILKFGLGSLTALALATAISVSNVTPAVSQSGYFGQRATQDRDYSRMQAATNRAYKSETITMKKKKKMKHKHKRKHRKHQH